MAVRIATQRDIPALIEIGRRIHAESRFQRMGYDADKLAHSAEQIVVSGHSTHCCFVSEFDGQVTGLFLGCIEEYFFSRARVAHSILMYVAPERRGGPTALRFIMAFRNWATNRNAAELTINVASGVSIARTDRFLKRVGLRLTGGNYSVALGAKDYDQGSAALSLGLTQ
jgi:hypothetical protein